MGSPITLAVISVSAWLIIAALSVSAAHRGNPTESRGVSVLGFVVMAVVVFGAGYAINLWYDSAGTWIVLASHSAFIVIGVISEMRKGSKRKEGH